MKINYKFWDKSFFFAFVVVAAACRVLIDDTELMVNVTLTNAQCFFSASTLNVMKRLYGDKNSTFFFLY